MSLWKLFLSEAVSAAAYGAVAVALLGLFRAPGGPAFGRLRWLILLTAGATAGLHVALGLNAAIGGVGFGEDLSLAKSGCELVLGLCLFPVLRGVQPRMIRALGKRGLKRLERADEEASEALDWLALAEGAGHFGHWRLDLKDRALAWSDEMFRVHGVAQAQGAPALAGMVALYHPEDRTAVSGGIARLTTQNGALELAARVRRPDGEMRHVVLRARRHKAASIIGVLVDVTERKVAEARMREANQVALQANAALKEMTLEDLLTGLSNRRQFDLSLVHEFKRALRSNLPLGLVLINLDHFQAYNEQYGQEAGDGCLRRVAQAIKAIPRRVGDVVARYGGGEIVVLLPLADGNGAMRVAGVILEAVRGLRIPHSGGEAGIVTISCGVAAFSSLADLNNPLELVRRADQALYRAKADGRDRVVRFEPGMGGDPLDGPIQAVMQDMERFIKSR